MPRRISISECEICKQIQDREYVDHIRKIGSDLPKAYAKLVHVLTIGIYYPLLLKCPCCGRYYEYYTDVGYMEHDESLERYSDLRCDLIDAYSEKYGLDSAPLGLIEWLARLTSTETDPLQTAIAKVRKLTTDTSRPFVLEQLETLPIDRSRPEIRELLERLRSGG